MFVPWARAACPYGYFGDTNLAIKPLSACKKTTSFFVGVGKHYLMQSDNVYPPLMNSVISRVGSYSFTTPKKRFLHFVREGEAPDEPLTANGSPGGSSSHTLIKTSEDFPKLASVLSSMISADNRQPTTDNCSVSKWASYLITSPNEVLCDLLVALRLARACLYSYDQKMS